MKHRNISLLVIAALAAASSLVQAAPDSLVINLRFADGSTEHTLTSADVGHDVEVDVWATITGQNAPSSNNFFGLDYAYYAIASSLPKGPTDAVDGGLTMKTTADNHTTALVAPFNALGSQVGTLQDINGDGVADVGPVLVTAMTDYAKPSPRYTVWGTAGVSTEHALPTGYEFEVEQLYFHVNSLSGDETDYAPISAELSIPYEPTNWAADVPSYVQNGPIGAQYTRTAVPMPGSEVQFLVDPSAQPTTAAVPEPTAAALVFGLSLLPLRRRSKRRAI